MLANVKRFKHCFLVIINVCVSLLVACCSLHSKAKETLRKTKREEQQGKKKKEQEENTYIRIRTTSIKTVHVIKTIERQDNVRNITQQERREEREDTRQGEEE